MVTETSPGDNCIVSFSSLFCLWRFDTEFALGSAAATSLFFFAHCLSPVFLGGMVCAPLFSISSVFFKQTT